MSLVTKIDTEKCPHCGAPYCEEGVKQDSHFGNQTGPGHKPPEIRGGHNGDRWEYRSFTCGFQLEYIPNYRKVMPHEYRICGYDPAHADVAAARVAFIEKLVKYANRGTINVDQLFREHCIRKLKGWDFRIDAIGYPNKEPR